MGTVREVLAGRNVQLRKLRPSDAEAIFQKVNDSEVVRWTTRIPHPYPEDGAGQFIGKSLEQWEQGSAYVYAITLLGSDELAGVISLGNVFLKHGCAELGFWLEKACWGKGLMTDAAQLILQVAFEDLGLYRVYASTFEANLASRKVLEKAGFQLEGVMREAVVRYDQRQNFMNFGILLPEYRSSSAD